MSTRSLARGLLERMSSARAVCPHHNSDGRPIKVAKLSQGGHGPNTDYAFEMVCSTLRFGRGVTTEIGYDVRNLGAKHTMVVTDRNVANTVAFKTVAHSLQSLGIKYTVFDDVKIEPSDASMKQAIDFARDRGCDSFVAVGGGSVIDTTKAVALYCSNPQADFLDYVCPPFGKNLIPKNPMLPLIAVPTTAGTGSETTGAAIMDLPEKHCKTGIRQRCIKPLLAIIDPLNVMRSDISLFIVYFINSGGREGEEDTNRRKVLKVNEKNNTIKRSPRPLRPELRPVYQGSNPISDVWAKEALRIIGRFFRRSVFDPADEEARTQMLMASSFAGMGFGNAGVHICHGLSYPISSQGKCYHDVDYPSEKPLIPHGLSVITTAVADFEFLTSACPERHAEAARQLGANIPISADSEYISRTLCDQIRGFMSDFQVPNGLKEMGFEFSDIGRVREIFENRQMLRNAKENIDSKNENLNSDNLASAAMNSVPNIAITPRATDREIIWKIYEKSLSVY
uniref:hydroxyacid-oxoacid transhydrogenase n=1 Tax=Heterorhabditis bacteriophora TaxID=37862 RepID=A0A1I7WWB7_HETBA